MNDISVSESITIETPTHNTKPTPPAPPLGDLPCPNTRRWDTKRKAQVVEAVRSGRLSLERACSIYTMSVDEFLTWQSLFDRYGAKGLMATRVKQYRRTYQRAR